MSEEILDQWQIALQQKKSELNACQREQQVESCLKCEKVLDCEIRDAPQVF